MLELAGLQDLIHKLVREVAFVLLICRHPLFQYHAFDAAHGLHFRDTCIRYSVHVACEQCGFVLRGQVAVMGDALIEIVGHEVEDVLLEVGAGTTDTVDFILADHLGQRYSQLGRAHCACDSYKHLAAVFHELDITFGGVHHRRRVEVPVVPLHELGDRTHYSSVQMKLLNLTRYHKNSCQLQAASSKGRRFLQFKNNLFRLKSERVGAGDVRAYDERVDIVSTLIGLDRFQVHHVAHYGVVIGDSIGPEDVAGHAGALQGHPDVVALGHGDMLMLNFFCVFQTANL